MSSKRKPPISLRAALRDAVGEVDYLRPESYDDEEHRRNFERALAANRKALDYKLYFVRADDNGSGGDRDLFVRAKTPKRALKFWREYYECEPREKPFRIHEIPDDPAEGAIPWNMLLVFGEWPKGTEG